MSSLTLWRRPTVITTGFPIWAPYYNPLMGVFLSPFMGFIVAPFRPIVTVTYAFTYSTFFFRR